MNPPAASDGLETRLVRVHGRVQGVGFRDACLDAADRFGVTGWVRNRSDGTVEALLHGPADAVERMQRWLRDGVPHARVAAVDVTNVKAPAPRPIRFERLPTA